MKRRMNVLCTAMLSLWSALCTAQGQSTAFKVLYSFAASPNAVNNSGSFPVGLTISGNTLYGTAEQSGVSGSGTVFAFNTGNAKLTSLYSFTAVSVASYPFANSDGSEPDGLVSAGGRLYGTAAVGGPSGAGTLFSLNNDGSGFGILHIFTASTYSPDYATTTNIDGYDPAPGLILSGNILYGTAKQGGPSGTGTVFAVNTNGSGFTILHSFSPISGGNSDGAFPGNGLVLSGNVLYGTTANGGSSGSGTVFAVNTDGSGFTTLYTFSAGANNGSGAMINGDGIEPAGGLTLSGNTLYGTAEGGGSGGAGTVFAVDTAGSGFTTLHSFAAVSSFMNSEGSAPLAALTLVSNTLYGTASDGGSAGSGTLFAVNTDGTDFTVLHTFTGGSDGADPNTQLVLAGNLLYGATAEGGTEGTGTLFSFVAGPVNPPAITNEPASQTANLGGSVTLQVTATGGGALTYQWTHNGVKIPGATGDLLTLKKITAANAGNYAVVVSDSAGSVTSSVAVITVLVPPAITVQPANLTEPLAGDANFTTKATGAPLTYQWMFTPEGQSVPIPLSDGGNITGSATNKLTITSVIGENEGSYFVVISNSATAVTSKIVELNVSTEKTKPSVVITSPKGNSRTNAPVLSGTASDAVRVFSVGYWVTNKNNGAITVLSGQAALATGKAVASNWTIQTMLLPGTNILAVRSTNYAGLASAVVNSTFFYEVPALFSLVENGPGTVTGTAAVAKDVLPANNALLNIGEGYTLTAHPDKNCLLSNWVTESFTSNSPTLRFIMETNLTITANFGTNLFIGAAGKYNGLFYGNNVTEQTAGMLKNLVIGTTGAYSASLLLGGASYVVSGSAFNTSLQSSATVKRAAAKGGPVVIEMTLDGINGSITGSVSNATAGGWVSPLEAEKAATGSSGEFTVLLAPGTNSSGDIAPGDGYILVTNHNGTVTLTGALADGSAFSQSVPLGVSGDVPVFNDSLYTDTGLLLGWIGLSNGAVEAETPLAWIKPSVRSGLFISGFTNSLLVSGSAWTNLPATTPATSGTLTISDTSLSLNFAVSLNSKTVVKASDEPTNSLIGTVAAKTGLLTITFGNGTGRATTIGHAVLLQDAASGGGYFVTGTNTGAISLTEQQ
jgi:uncharacterized repeat protein (TIGR03803 family)